MTSPDPIDVAAFEAANSRAYLRAVFDAWGQGRTVMALPESAAGRVVPGTRVVSRDRFAPDPGWFDANLGPCPEDDPALIAFSSGTTGQPKAILLQHRALQDVVGRINTAMGIDDSIREYLGVPVTFSFGFGRARAVATAGGQSYLPEHGFDPAEIGRMLSAGDINAVSAVPTLWRVLLANKGSIPAESARNLKWIEIGSQWMTGAEKLELRRLFPNARIVQHYGLTEASRSTLLDVSEAPEDRLDSVGRAEGRVEIAIDDEGRIRTRGPHLAQGLVTAEGVIPVADDDGWLTTSDRGRLEDGWLYYEGRVDELINSGGLKIDPTAFEQAVNAALGVPGAVAAGRLADPMRGEKVLLALRADAGLDRDRVIRAIRDHADRIGLVGNGAFELREVAGIPLTATGKVKRAELADLPWNRDISETGSGGSSRQDSPPETAALQALWGEILGLDDVPIDRSFYELGGDSISALTAILKMEALGIDPDIARGIFEGKTIAEMAGITPEARPDRQTDTGSEQAEDPTGPALTLGEAVNALHATRGVLVLWVVAVHWLPALLLRMGGNAIDFYTAMIPAWRLGTPGFAIVFGMGLGALGIHRYQTNRSMFLKSNRFNTKLVVSGALLLALAKFLAAAAEEKLGSRLVLSSIFYSVITFYALALLTLPVIAWAVTRGTNRLLTVLLLGAGAAMVHMILHANLAHYQPVAALETLKLLLTAKYGYFRMLSFVMIGVAIGWLYRRHHKDPDVIRTLALYGLVLVGFGGVGTAQALNDGVPIDFGRTDLWHLSIYAGIICLMLAGFARLNRNGGPVAFLPRSFNAFLTASGILALPIFVGHEVFFAIKQLVDAFGVPDSVSLSLLLGLFFGGLFIAYRKLWRVVASQGVSGPTQSV